MDLELKGRVAIVQGASKGIGLGIADALAAEGCRLVLAARGEGPLLAAQEDLARRHRVEVASCVADSADPATAHRLADLARRTFGRLDIVVANSGGPPPGGFEELGTEQWRAAFELVLLAPVELLRAAVPLLRQSDAPRFLVVTSSSTREPVQGLTLSNTFRPGIVGLVKTLSAEMGPWGLRVHSLAPGRIDTDRLGAVIDRQAEMGGVPADEVRAGMLGTIPAGRLGTPADLGSAAAFLCSTRADYLNGLNLLVDGGLVKSL